MNVVVTGATGFVGRQVVRQLHQQGDSIRILTRHAHAKRVLEAAVQSAAVVAPGDVLAPESLQEGFQGADAIIHLVGIISETGRSTFENIHTAGTQNVVKAAQSSGATRLLHMSALGTRPGAISRYHQSKWAAEEMVRQSGLKYTIFRPSLIYGPEDHFVNLFSKIARFSPVLPVMGRTSAQFQPVAVEVVAAAFAKALREPSTIQQTLDLCGPDRLTLPELLDQILEVTERRRLKLYVPLPLARLQAALVQALYGGILRKPPPFNRDQLIMLQEDNVGDCRKAEAMLSLTQRTFGEGIGSYLKPESLKRKT